MCSNYIKQFVNQNIDHYYQKLCKLLMKGFDFKWDTFLLCAKRNAI